MFLVVENKAIRFVLERKRKRKKERNSGNNEREKEGEEEKKRINPKWKSANGTRDFLNDILMYVLNLLQLYIRHKNT